MRVILIVSYNDQSRVVQSWVLVADTLVPLLVAELAVFKADLVGLVVVVVQIRFRW